MDKYILKGRNAIRIDDAIEWVKSFESNSRIVAETILPEGTRVSTVFLGIDHNFYGGAPHIFETMIFGGEHDGYQERYSSWDQAEKGHTDAVALVNGEKVKHKS